MGITGLLPLLKSISEEKTLAEYRGETLAVDGYCWLHQVMHRCGVDDFLDPKSERYIDYFLARVDNLVRQGVSPYIVFDGGPLPSKAHTEEARRLTRKKNREKAIKFLSQKNKEQARKHFIRSVDISPYMAHRVILRLRQKNIKYVVAPYEADAQLAYLVKRGLVNGVITEDSDCLIFNCDKVLFKLNYQGAVREIKVQNILKNSEPDLQFFTHDMFIEMCIFSGCDYLANLPRIGLKTSYNLFKKYGSVKKVFQTLRLEGKVNVPESYEDGFARAKLTFKHQRVYDPLEKKLVFLSPPSDELRRQITDWSFLGLDISDAYATAVAIGDIDPITMKCFGTPQSDFPLAQNPFSSVSDKTSTLIVERDKDCQCISSSSLSCETDREESDRGAMSSQSQEASIHTKEADRVLIHPMQKAQEETAFDRMMRAGSQLQKRSLKRKRVEKISKTVSITTLNAKPRFFGLQPLHSSQGPELSILASNQPCNPIPHKIAKAELNTCRMESAIERPEPFQRSNLKFANFRYRNTNETKL
ncbi:unnamed protein product [Albugo candida]|uniref:Uncharacterized protein n=1 Tax=Albugo candida TaxID=65357 RepID=A0A024GJ91_9STRA|nr:unnamed protein product [Albugo candida]|eukprot:CCI46786.1 unnamed protein product [Albugo candida]